jgi:hypothetical protein
MKRQLLTLALAGFFGAMVLSAGSASACCHKKATCAPATCAPVACEPAPPPPPPPPPPVVECPPPKKCCGICGRKFRLFGHGLCKKKAACAPTVCVTPVAYPVPVYVAPTPQAYPTGQASGQGS